MCQINIVVFGVILLAKAFLEVTSEETAQVEVRAVLINCELDDGQELIFDNEATRFEREELFKHSMLKDCHKKLAITVKITSDPNNSGDEYIPIEHVFQGPRKRVRLLNPYVLRLRREPPVQAYKLRKIETVSGVLTKDTETRNKRNLESSDAIPVQIEQLNLPQLNSSAELPGTTICGVKSKRSNKDNICLNSRNQRHGNDLNGNFMRAGENPHRTANGTLVLSLDLNEEASASNEDSRIITLDDNMSQNALNSDGKSETADTSQILEWRPIINGVVLSKTTQPISYTVSAGIEMKDLKKSNPRDHHLHRNKAKYINKKVKDHERGYEMYEIGNADLWYSIQVQLFEKLSTPEGKSIWKDLSKGKPTRVSSLAPEWVAYDMSVRYRSSEWVPREEFILPETSLYLLAPLQRKTTTPLENYNTADQYIVVPREDVVGLATDENFFSKRDDNLSDREVPPIKQKEQSHRRVNIRTARAMFGGIDDKVTLVTRNGDEFLTLVHEQPYHAQIDLEARADGNQLVHVGYARSSGRIMTVVADSSRPTRTVLTVQATNTGLAAARFRLIRRDCNLELPEVMKERLNEDDDGYVVLPPKHTQSIRLEVSYEAPVDVAHCSVVLVNGDDQSVAVRDVKIKKGDRCFCVWHCECVCLRDDPKLLCREMAEARQVAAGLSLRERTRHVRSVCYHDVMSLNLCVTAFGVVTTLLLCGLIKACLGLIMKRVGSWGLLRILQIPRKLDRYYETSLRNRPVVYDNEGWPVHPDTEKRTVRLTSVPMEFILNLIFFVTAPCIIIYDALRQALNRYKKRNSNDTDKKSCSNTKDCFSSHDMQTKDVQWRRRRTGLRRWMTPDAEELSLNIWQEGLSVQTTIINDDMQPLLKEQFCHCGGGETMTVAESCGDSEVDDTEYVLMQMQKSRESLARSQRKLNDSVPASTKK